MAFVDVGCWMLCSGSGRIPDPLAYTTIDARTYTHPPPCRFPWLSSDQRVKAAVCDSSDIYVRVGRAFFCPGVHFVDVNPQWVPFSLLVHLASYGTRRRLRDLLCFTFFTDETCLYCRVSSSCVVSKRS